MKLANRKPVVFGVVGAFLLVIFLQMFLMARDNSATYDEPSHIYSGYLQWKHGYVLLNPPLITPRHTRIFDQFGYAPISLRRGRIQVLAGQQDLARRSFEAARLELEQKVKEDPDDHRFHSSLGIAYAGLGRSMEAVREATLGCALMPASKDALRALGPVRDLALVYTMVGQISEAIVQLDDLLGRSGEFTPNVLRLDPMWDPLRSDPRFQALLTKYEVKP